MHFTESAMKPMHFPSDRRAPFWRSRSAAWLCCTCCAFCLCDRAVAQMRPGQPPVLVPAPVAAPLPLADPAARFSAAYVQAGRPRIVLLWNRELSDRTQTAMQERTVVRESGTSSSSSMENTSAGSSGSATLREGDQSFDRTTTTTKGQVAVGEPQRNNGLAEKHAVELQRAFSAEMRRAGVSFVDRAWVMRATAAGQHRAGADAALIEADALLKYADLALEVIWVADRAAPAGYGFDVRTKALRDGREVTAFYTAGVPSQPPQGPGGWVAGAEGYEFRRPPPPGAPSPADVGRTLAQEVMASLAGSLGANEGGGARRR